MKKYNIMADKLAEISRLTEESSCSMFKDTSSFLRGQVCQNARTRLHFNFITASAFNEIKIFYITITRKKYSNIYYGYDSTAFCLVRHEKELRVGVRYVAYGKLSKLKLYFIDCMEACEIEYRELCQFLL